MAAGLMVDGESGSPEICAQLSELSGHLTMKSGR
jgi:hypothetical protein